MNQNQKPALTPNKKLYLTCFLLSLALTLLTAFSAVSAVRNLAQTLLESVSDAELIQLLTPLQYLRFRVSLIPTALGALIVSLPVYRTAKATQTASRIGWIVLILLLLSIIWIISLFTLRIGLASMVKIILTLLRTLLNLI
jgi:hypothetical protein